MFDEGDQKQGGIAAYVKRLKDLPGSTSALPVTDSISRRALAGKTSQPGLGSLYTNDQTGAQSPTGMAANPIQGATSIASSLGLTRFGQAQDQRPRLELSERGGQLAAPGTVGSGSAFKPRSISQAVLGQNSMDFSPEGFQEQSPAGFGSEKPRSISQAVLGVPSAAPAQPSAPFAPATPGTPSGGGATANSGLPATSLPGATSISGSLGLPKFGQPQQDQRPDQAGQLAAPAMTGAPGSILEAMQRQSRANAIRQQQVDLQQPGGAAVLADPNDADNAEKTARWREDALIDKAKYNPQLAGIAGQVVQGNTARDLEAAKRPSIASSLGLQARGQDINRELQAGQQSISSRALELNNNRDNERLGLDRERFGLERQNSIAQTAARDALAKAMESGDQNAIARARTQAVALGVKLEPQANLQHVETDRGMMAFDPSTGKMTPAVGADGRPVSSSKPLTEYQGKSTGFGMRADAASKIIDQVGQDGKIQPSLIKRAAEAVPLVGEGLSMIANGMQSPEQQQVEQAQRDFVNSVLRSESGSAISQGEFDNARKQYFPQPGDSPEVVAQKQANREAAINGFRVSAGPGARNIGDAGQAARPAQQPQSAQQQASPSIGTVDGGYVFLGGNPNDQANWAEVRK